jgi:alanine racemase
MTSPSQARLSIDLDALAQNYATIAAEAAGAETAAVVKADAYGLGVGPVARKLWAADCRTFFVARLAEGEALRRELGPDRLARIFVLDGFLPGTGPRLEAAGLTPALATLPQVSAALGWAASRGGLEVALHIDTGMNRQGLTPAEARSLAQAPGALRGLDIVLLMSHLGSGTEPAEPRNGQQLDAFEAIRPLFAGVPASLAASGGAFLGPRYRFDIVRPGISLYGGGPEERDDPRFKAVATLTAPILDVRNFNPGDRIGYGAQVTVDSPTRAVTLGAGYADGVIRASRAAGHAWIAGARRRLLAVTMDLIVAEIDDATVTVGEHVELLGPNVRLDDVATAANTVAHEILTRISPRAERIYLGGT